VTCRKHGTCSCVGQGTCCTWGDGSACDDPCTQSACAPVNPPPPPPPITPPSGNKYGIGLVDQGNSAYWDKAHELAGDHGWILFVFAGIDSNRHSADQSWKDALAGAFARHLNPVLRLAPPWDRRNVRDMSDDAGHLVYTSIARSYADVVNDLRGVMQGDVWLQVHNEPNLCDEWRCQDASGTMTSDQMAQEFAYFFVAVAQAIRQLGDSRLHVTGGPPAPGGVGACTCCQSGVNCGYSGGATSYQFLAQMKAHKSDVFSYYDWMASHSYPSSAEGSGFGAPIDNAGVGLTMYKKELAAIGRSLQVIITETGWATNSGDFHCTEDQKSQWMPLVYERYWNSDSAVIGTTPFMLADQRWGEQLGYGWIHPDTSPYPIFNSVKQARQSHGY